MAKPIYIDNRVTVNGKKSSINLDNYTNITKLITDLATSIANSLFTQTKELLEVSDTYIVEDNNYYVIVTGTAGVVDITLPDATTVLGNEYVIYANDISDIVTVNAASGNINGNPTFALNAQYDYVKVVSDGTNYFVLDSRVTP